MRNYFKLWKEMLLEYEREKLAIRQNQKRLDRLEQLNIEGAEVRTRNQQRLDRIEMQFSTEYENEKQKVWQNQQRLDLLEQLNIEGTEVRTQNQRRLDRIEMQLTTEYENEKLKVWQNQQRLDTLEKTVPLLQKELDFLLATTQGKKSLVHRFNFFDKVTNAQSGEDAILAYIVFMLGIPFENCTYLDLGANKPVEGSNTNFFYTQGARGVLVEANPELIPALRKERPEDVILNKCVATEDGKTIEFIIMTGDGLSTADEEEAHETMRINPEIRIKQKVQVESISINTIMKSYFANETPVICSIDIEGKDMEILQSIDFEQYRPFLIVIETIPYSMEIAIGKKNIEICNYMGSVGYEEYAFTGINSVFIDKKALKEKWDYKF